MYPVSRATKMPGMNRPATSRTAPVAATQKRLPTSRQDFIVIALLVLLSWHLRTLYQAESTTDGPLRADAGRYARTAFNLHVHGAFSKEPPSRDAPHSRTDLAPGYPLFLTLFLEPTDADPGWYLEIDRVRATQAILGSVVALLTYLLARQFLSLGWATAVGLLTALSPHLIAISDYVLTESLFMLVMVGGFLLAAYAFRLSNLWLLFAASFLISLSAEVRYIALAMPLCLVPFVFMRSKSEEAGPVRSRLATFAVILAGVVCVQLLHVGFERLTVANAPDDRQNTPEHFQPKSPWEYLSRTVRPPNFFMDGQTHVSAHNPDPQHSLRRTEASFSDAPLPYLRWNTYGRLIVNWHFDNAYNGDVYLYPMLQKGFEENRLLQFIHRAMRLLHWPLLALAMVGLVILAVQTWRGTLVTEIRAAWLPALGLGYFIAVLTLLAWLPRYSIPARPFVYLLAMFCLATIARSFQSTQSFRRFSKHPQLRQ